MNASYQILYLQEWFTSELNFKLKLFARPCLRVTKCYYVVCVVCVAGVCCVCCVCVVWFGSVVCIMCNMYVVCIV